MANEAGQSLTDRETLNGSNRGERIPDPCIVVIFGASGDLTKRKLLPALFHLQQQKLLPQDFVVVGVARRDLAQRVPLTFAEALTTGSRATWVMGGAVVGTVHDLLVRKVSVTELGGPIAITRAAVSAARSGAESLFYLIALLSINVAVLNLLPIPLLDGGQILMNVIETAKGSPFTPRTRENFLRVGLVAIALIFAIVMFNDTKAWLGQFFS